MLESNLKLPLETADLETPLITPRIETISPNLFLFRDTCNVYIVRDGSTAVLIDFGNGDVLPALTELGIDRVTAVLMTHHHRDQGQGLARAVALGVPIYVPHTEQDLFAEIDHHWEGRPIANNYDVRQDRFSLLNPIPIAGTLEDYAEIAFGTQSFRIYPTPGHTVGSISLLATIDGQRIAFTGDLIAAPGKIWSLAATQWTYNGSEGISSMVLSLLDLKDMPLHALLPSHGEPMIAPAVTPAAAIEPLIDRLNALRLARVQNPRLYLFREHPYTAVLPHLLYNVTSISNSYVLLSESHKALFIDFGYDMVTWPLPGGTDRSSRRPWLYTIPMLKREFGVESIDVALSTHYHDDHVAGMNLLRAVEGTKIWAAETFADVLENPTAHNLPCLWYDPIPVDRRLPISESFTWEEYTFTLYPLPGHAELAVAIAFEVDGTRVLATGDQYMDAESTQYNYVYENRFQIGDYRRSAALYARLNPGLILSGHQKPLAIRPGFFEMLTERGDMLEQWHRDLLPLESYDLGGSDFVARIEPYQLVLEADQIGEGCVIVRNPHPQPETICVTFSLPIGWRATPDPISARLAAHAEARFPFRFSVPPDAEGYRIRIAADITIGTHHYGQHAEALITVN